MSTYRDIRKIRGVVVHSTATPNDEFCWRTTIDEWHAKRGFKRNPAIRNLYNDHLSAIGYHYVIQPDGEIESGRAPWESGAHAKGWNRTTIGVALAGTDEFTESALSSLWDLLVHLGSGLVPQNPTPFLCGHRDLPGVKKICPGFDVYDTAPDEVRDWYVPFDPEGHA